MMMAICCQSILLVWPTLICQQVAGDGHERDADCPFANADPQPFLPEITIVEITVN